MIHCLDNSHNNGGRRVTTEEAKQWDYTMTEDLQQKLYAIKQSYIDSGKLTADQIAALQWVTQLSQAPLALKIEGVRRR